MLENRPNWRRDLPAHPLQGIFLILTTLMFTTPALAHRVLIYAYAEGDTIHTESKFVPDTPVREGKILVMNQKTDAVLLTGQTDNEGKFSFKIPAEAAAQKLDLKIVVEASMGHRGEWLLKADSYLTGMEAEKAAAPDASAAHAPASEPSPTQAASQSKAAGLDQKALEEALNKTLQHQLAPMKEMLTDLSIHRTTPTDVIGGIGYILGIFGLLAFLQSKKNR